MGLSTLGPEDKAKNKAPGASKEPREQIRPIMPQYAERQQGRREVSGIRYGT
jgi:hypothetical protein